MMDGGEWPGLYLGEAQSSFGNKDGAMGNILLLLWILFVVAGLLFLLRCVGLQTAFAFVLPFDAGLLSRNTASVVRGDKKEDGCC